MKFLFLFLLTSLVLTAAEHPKKGFAGPRNEYQNTNRVSRMAGRRGFRERKFEGERSEYKEQREQREHPERHDRQEQQERRRYAEMRGRIEGIMQWLRLNKPEEFEKITALAEENPHALVAAMEDIVERYADELPKNLQKPQRRSQKYNSKINRLTEKYKKCEDPATKAQLKDLIKTALEEDYDRQQKKMQEEYRKMAQGLKRFKNRIDRMQQQKDKQINARLKRLTD